MNRLLQTTGLAASFVLVSIFQPVAEAKDTVSFLPIKAAFETSDAKEKLGKDIRFYFAGQGHPAVEARMSKGVVSNKKTNSSNKSNEAACNRAMLSALLQLQERARNEGGNAVINIESYYKKKSFKSKDQFECHSGLLMSGVALKGDVVKLKR